jgi:hypothetical protein
MIRIAIGFVLSFVIGAGAAISTFLPQALR